MHRITIFFTILFSIVFACSSVNAQHKKDKAQDVIREENTAKESQNTDGQKDTLGADEWPTTLDAVVKDILASLPDEDKEIVRKTKRNDLIMFHHGWGTGIRNYYGLWRGNDKLIESACGGPCHPDDASMIIIERVWESLQN